MVAPGLGKSGKKWGTLADSRIPPKQLEKGWSIDINIRTRRAVRTVMAACLAW